MSATFETLSDEILITIFRYSDDVYTLFRTFLGLNQRLNRILIDKRSHLFADFLYINTHDIILVDYYKSDVLQNVSHQLSCLNSPIKEEQLRQCFQSLVTFHIKEQFTRLGNQVQLNLIRFGSMREQLHDIEIVDIDNQIQNIFFDLRDISITIRTIKQIESLVFTRAARLQCGNHESSQFNLAKALNQLLLRHLNNIYSTKRLLIHPITQMFKTLIISNTNLLMNRDHTDIEEGSSIWHFLFYSIYQLQYWYYTPPDIYINMKCYQAVVDLLLLAIQCQKQTNNNQHWAEQSLFDILKMISDKRVSNQNELFIQSVQWEILKIIVDENVVRATIPWREDQEDAFRLILNNLIGRNRLDVILLIYHELQNVRSYFDKPNNIYRNVNILTGSSIGRQLFKIFLEEKPLKSWIICKDLIFLLLQKKERKLLQELLKSSPLLIHQVNDDGNDPLLYVCLKVRGCRHRIIKFLIMIGCDLGRKNLNGENFLDAIQLKRNERLLKDLLETGIIEIDDESRKIQVTVRTQQQSSIEN